MVLFSREYQFHSMAFLGLVISLLVCMNASATSLVTLSASQDTYVVERSDGNFSHEKVLRISHHKNEHRVLVQFDLSQMNIPLEAIESADLIFPIKGLYKEKNHHDDERYREDIRKKLKNKIELYTMSSSWSEKSTSWSCSTKPCNHWNGGYSNQRSMNTNVAIDDDRLIFDVKQQVQSSFVGQAQWGWMLKADKGFKDMLELHATESGHGPELHLTIDSNYDVFPPEITFESNLDTRILMDKAFKFDVEFTDDKAIVAESIAILLDGFDITQSCLIVSGKASCSPNGVVTGAHTLNAFVVDESGKTAESQISFLFFDMNESRSLLGASWHPGYGVPSHDFGSIGDFYLDVQSGDVYSKVSASIWITELNIKGNKGEQGDKGEQGLAGVQGEKGDKGEQGLAGVQGEKGDKGEQGIAGLQGVQGVKGDIGEKGEKGQDSQIASLACNDGDTIRFMAGAWTCAPWPGSVEGGEGEGLPGNGGGDLESQLPAFASCRDILENGQSVGNGVYTITPGSDGAQYSVYCDMTTQGGGWTLVAKHKDNIQNTQFQQPVMPNGEFGVILNSAWQSVYRTMTTGMMFIDEQARVSVVSQYALEQASCIRPEDINSLAGHRYIYHYEDINCDTRSLDYTLIQLEDLAYGSGASTGGASLYNYGNIGFDIWPYANGHSSSDQNELLYFVK